MEIITYARLFNVFLQRFI